MKTKAYNPQEGIKAIIITVVLLFGIMISKAQNLPAQPTLESFTANISTPDNKLVGIEIDSTVKSAEVELAAEMQAIINSGSYWDTENNADQNVKLTEMISDWMKKGLYWNEYQTSKPNIELDPIAERNDE